MEYSLHVLTVYISDGLQPNARFELCIRAENIFLPQGGYFGKCYNNFSFFVVDLFRYYYI